MKKFVHTLYYISGKIYIPSSLLKVKNTILHISDTPSNIYPELIRLVKKLSPDYIIHTGDVVDNIKLELYPFKLKEYEKLSINFIKSLTPLVKKEVIIVPGNHDYPYLLKDIPKVKLINEGETISINSTTIGLAHKFDKLPSKECSFYLYGHDKSSSSKKFLNGIKNIHVIELDTHKVFHLKYPINTDSYRLLRTKIGM